MVLFSPKAGSGPYHSAAAPRVKPLIRRRNGRLQNNTFRDIPTRFSHSLDVLIERTGGVRNDD